MRVLFLLSFVFFCREAIASDLSDKWDQECVGKVVEGTAHKTYTRINQSKLWDYPPSIDDNGRLFKTESPEWEMQLRAVLNRGVLQSEAALIKKRESTLSQALKSLEESPSTLDCMIVINFVGLKCLETLLGEDSLDKLCQQWEEKYAQPFYFSNIGYNSLCNLFFDLHRISIFDWKGSGGFTCMSNDPTYMKISTNIDRGHGENLVQSGIDNNGELLFIGFNFPNALPLKSITDVLQADFDKTAKARGVSVSWNETEFLKRNNDSSMCIRTFSARLINTYLATSNIAEAEENNIDVLKVQPLLVIIPEYLLGCFTPSLHLQNL